MYCTIGTATSLTQHKCNSHKCMQGVNFFSKPLLMHVNLLHLFLSVQKNSRISLKQTTPLYCLERMLTSSSLADKTKKEKVHTIFILLETRRSCICVCVFHNRRLFTY